MQSSALLHYYLQQFSGRSCAAADSNGRPVKCHTVRTAPAISGHDTKLIKWHNCNTQPQPACQMSFCHCISIPIAFVGAFGCVSYNMDIYMERDKEQSDIMIADGGHRA